jgi:hypothetical protein
MIHHMLGYGLAHQILVRLNREVTLVLSLLLGESCPELDQTVEVRQRR